MMLPEEATSDSELVGCPMPTSTSTLFVTWILKGRSEWNGRESVYVWVRERERGEQDIRDCFNALINCILQAALCQVFRSGRESRRLREQWLPQPLSQSLLSLSWPSLPYPCPICFSPRPATQQRASLPALVGTDLQVVGGRLYPFCQC